MRIIKLLIVLASATVAPKRRERQARGMTKTERDHLLLPVLREHPSWSTVEVYQAARPIAHAAGFRMPKYPLFADQVNRWRVTHNLPAERSAAEADRHTAHLNEEFLWDPDQPVQSVIASCHAKFGPGAISDRRIRLWWTRARAGATENADPGV